MGQGDGKKFDPNRPLSIPPELSGLDATWDDDLPDPFSGAGPLDDAAFDRPTPIVEIPLDLLHPANAPTERPPAGAPLPPQTGQTLAFGPDDEVPSLPPEPPPPAYVKPIRRAPEDSFPLAGMGSLDRTIPYGEAPDSARPVAGEAPPDRTIPFGVAPAPARTPEARPTRSGRVPTADLTLELDDLAGEASPLELANRIATDSPSSPTSSSPISAADLLQGRDIESAGRPQPGPKSSGRRRPDPHLPAAPLSTPADDADQMRDRFAAGDFTGALVLAEGILEADSADQEAQQFAEKCREVLAKMYLARIGSLDRVVKVIVADDQIRWLSLDHRAGFLLSLADGTSRVEELLDISGMPRLEALRILFTLLEQGAISIE